MGTDRYRNFHHLSMNENLGRDYLLQIKDRGSDITVVAIHGGRIEPQTIEIARKIAGDQHSLYSFEGIKRSDNQDLHITSHRFDEPLALDLVSKSKTVVAVHACKDKEKSVYIGGRFRELKKHIRNNLESEKIVVISNPHSFPGRHENNICNRGILKKGVQLEISRGFRDHPEALHLLCEKVRSALTGFHLPVGVNTM